jgi:hypothetical protein
MPVPKKGLRDGSTHPFSSPSLDQTHDDKVSCKQDSRMQFPILLSITEAQKEGRAPLIGERAQATLRGRPRGRLGTVGSGNGCLRGRPRGRLGVVGSETAFFRDRLDGLGSTQGTGAIL